MPDRRHHVEFRDNVSGESLGLLLEERRGLGYRRQLLNPYAAKGSQGGTRYSDLTEWSVQVFDDWVGGRGYEELSDPAGYFDGHGVETRVQGQLTLGPLSQSAASTDPEHMPGDVTEYLVGHPGELASHDTGNDYGGNDQEEWYAQKFVAPDSGQWWVKSLKFSVKKNGSGHTGTVKAAIYSVGAYGFPDAELASGTLAHTEVGSSYAEVTVPLSSVYSLTPGASYFVVFKFNNSGDYYVQGKYPGTYADGYTCYSSTEGSGWTQWGTVDLYFAVVWAKVALEQSFTAPAGGMDCDEAQLYLRQVGSPGSLTVALYSDSGGSPNAELVTDTITAAEVDTVAGWVSATWSAETLTGSTTYHLVVLAPGTADAEGSYYVWGGDADAGYGGSAKRKLDAGSWSAVTPDLYFRIYDSTGRTAVELDATPTQFARFNGKWYVAAGDTVYEWDSVNSHWDTSEASAGNNVTSMAVWAGFLWVARGTSTNVRKFNGSAWSDGGVEADLLYAGGPVGADGWLHRSDPDTTNQFYYTADGSTWSSAVTAGASDHAITGFAWYRDVLVIATTVGLYGYMAETVVQLVDWRSMEDANNGKGMFAWGRDAALYIPLLYGLIRWDGDRVTSVGPEQGAPPESGGSAYPSAGPGWVELAGGGSTFRRASAVRVYGLPVARAGRILAIWGTVNWLFVAVEGGAGYTSSVMATSGRRDWHEVARAETTAQTIQAVGFETISSPHRLWYGLGSETRYLELPDYSDNPYGWSGLSFNDTGELTTSWVGSDLVEVVKDLHEVVVRGEGISSSQPVEVWYEVDRSGRWAKLGEINESPRDVLPFEVSGPTTKTIGSGSTRTTIELSGSTTSDMQAGQWVRINGEVAQVAGVSDSDTFTLETALRSAPVNGEYVYASRPAGREVRLKLVLKTSSATETPLVKAVLLRYQPNVTDRWAWHLNVKVDDGMTNVAGGPYEMDAETLRGELAGWVKRPTPFTLVDPDGDEWTVKVSNAAERGLRRRRVGEHGAWHYGSTWDVTLVEVG